MRLKKFNEVQSWGRIHSNEIPESSDEAIENAKAYLKEAGIDANVIKDAEDVMIVEVKKKNECFSPESIQNMNKGNMSKPPEGIHKGEFAGDFVTVDDLSQQILIVDSIAYGLTEDTGGSLNRIYLQGDCLIIDITLPF
jgi:hypothetical protein